MPPIAPAIPPIPTTELTDSLGNMSEAIVKILVAHAWCTAITKLIKATATHTFVTNCASITDNSIIAKMNNAVCLAFNTRQPFFIK